MNILPNKFPEMQEGGNRTAYIMRVAALHIRNYAYEDTTHYDKADCDGFCIADELENEANEIERKWINIH